MTKVLTARVPDELADWADEYAKKRGVTRQALIEESLRQLRELSAGGVPDLPDEPKVQAVKAQVTYSPPVMPANPYAAFDLSPAEHIQALAARQAALNAAKDRAS